MTRPSFAIAWAASQKIYDPSDSSARVARMIGGNVEKNVNNPDPRRRWRNTCAVRMSYILSEAGMIIPAMPGLTVTGADRRQYFYRVRNLIDFLKDQWGKPEVVNYPPADGGNFADRKGVFLFEVSGWSDALGHATLFDGRICYDHCYFNEPEARYTTDRANFWSLS